jgi:hypothetical protein
MGGVDPGWARNLSNYLANFEPTSDGTSNSYVGGIQYELSSSDLIVDGDFTGTVNFGQGPLVSAGQNGDMYVGRLKP